MAVSSELIIVIDGPAGAGKSTIAQHLAQHYDLPLLDTGAIYRALAWVAKQQGIAWDDETKLAELAEALPISFHPDPYAQGKQRILLQDRDISQEIRHEEISQGASQVSALSEVRSKLLGLQRRLGEQGCVAEGRDMGTVVFPNAPHKFFLTANLEVRAQRRFDQLRLVHPKLAESAFELEQIKRDIQQRDERDSSRAMAPLQQAKDAQIIDSTHLTIQEVVSEIIKNIESAEQSQRKG